MHVVERKHPQGRSFEMQFDPDNMLVLVMRNGEPPTIAIGWRFENRWAYQSLMWSCRGGRQFWYRPLVTLYRHIRKNKLTDHSLRFMAWGECRLKHGGYVYGSNSHRNLEAVGARLALNRQREAAIAAGAKAAINAIDLGERWSLEVGSNDFYILNERTRAAGAVTESVTVKVVFESIFIQRTTGISRYANDPDPFRKMTKRCEGELIRIIDETLSEERLVDAAMSTLKQMMNIRSDEEWAAVGAVAA